jgi:glycosyltransferase 2 family protein
VDGTEPRHRADETAGHKSGLRLDRTRALIGGAILAVVLVAAGIAIFRQRDAIGDTLQRVGLGAMLLSGAFGLVGVAATFPVWREVLTGLDVDMPWAVGTRVFFVSQLGKYVPGSIWPVVMQMEAGRLRGASRRTMLAANLVTIVLSCAVGLLVACALLPLYDATALRRYWWLLLALPVLFALLHPRTLPALLDRMFGLLRRPPLGERLDPHHEARAAGWSVLGWLGLGAHLTVLCVALGHGGVSTLLLCTGGIAFAVCAGVLFIPVPAGAGIRDVIIALVLGGLLGSSAALAVAIASRVILSLGDVLLALLASTVRPRCARGHR